MFATVYAATNATPDPVNAADVQEEVQEAIELLAVTAEQQQENIKKVFDQIKPLPSESALAEVCKWLTNDEATKRRVRRFTFCAHCNGRIPVRRFRRCAICSNIKSRCHAAWPP